jgi:hypothetical protein
MTRILGFVTSMAALFVVLASCKGRTASKGDLGPEDVARVDVAIALIATKLDRPEQQGAFMVAPIKLAPDLESRMSKYDSSQWTARCDKVRQSFTFEAGTGGRANRGIEFAIATDGHCSCQYAGQPPFAVDFLSGAFGVSAGGLPFLAKGTRAKYQGKAYVFDGRAWVSDASGTGGT